MMQSLAENSKQATDRKMWLHTDGRRLLYCKNRGDAQLKLLI